jgi:hypothetical protein
MVMWVMSLICQWCRQQLVEVDNPFRREIRHRRGQENQCPGPPKDSDDVRTSRDQS